MARSSPGHDRAMRVMFALYAVGIAAGITVYTVVGLTGG
ncbi:MAG: hypothetical protein AVDCRST_MAG79-254 [uncultured Thermoleophilia bacterium]|uniref:Uncharacterized protein n=1 Tax=uncultured Thermoleophilia bacterium TaxID=1497501 RepID=A0A6J4TF34_9ACTN|nr:MAG: hypothetical protein AVDCRST_MAG79-254 [uncultured Thermoleophilia bacterium]